MNVVDRPARTCRAGGDRGPEHLLQVFDAVERMDMKAIGDFACKLS